MNCVGPCSEHCYTKNNIKALILGIFLGILLYYLVLEFKKKYESKKN